jgi:hypothetical protein
MLATRRTPDVIVVKDSSWNSGEASCSVSTGDKLIVHLGDPIGDQAVRRLEQRR